MKHAYEPVVDEAEKRPFQSETPSIARSQNLDSIVKGRLVSWRLVFDVLLVGVAILSLLVAYSAVKYHDSLVLSPGGSPCVDVPTIRMKFTASDYWLEPAMFYNETILIDKMERFVELSSDDRGIVVINDWKEHNLPPPRIVNPKTIGGPNETKSTYTIAYWHHIHCIASVAKLYYHARTGTGKPEHDDEHMVHCLEVLRNAVMCLADTTPEDGVNWWENTHQCRDYQQLRSWASDHSAWNWTEIMGPRVDLL
ncbi:hypothetical protein O1611_g233 [Lasiodiplodia mahajangana]|uniref:Uncharacterized protein n=1 Tax=Lasiodiplodia mahajangana TaxID=1108764 RepID=A0ACC2K0S2_9PEZI|nr:hypothetical protein O1611_g233 [Lasiodiplodia mahajangana]